MTTFTTEDRILAEKNGSFTVNVEGGTVSSPPHIVENGASVIIKDLTDEEIENIYWSLDSTGYDGTFSFIEFARAILRKAQEK